VLPLLVFLSLGAQDPVTGPPRDLSIYWRAATEYRSGDRQRALREIQGWGSSEIFASIRALREEANRRREVALSAGEVVKLPVEIDFRTVEAAALMHVEAGLLDLQSLATGSAEIQLGAATRLVEWSHELAARRLEELASLELAESSKERPDRVRLERLRRALSVELRIGMRELYVALAAATLAAGFPEAALPFADKAGESAPRDGDVLLVGGCVRESLAHEEGLQGHEERARRLREDAEASFRGTLAADPTATEARLRLGRVLIDEGRPREAEPMLWEAVEGATDRGQLYLALLLLGRALERLDETSDAATLYCRALETWPDSQAARLALARCLESSAGPSAARALVMASLLDSRDPAREPDPWWSYPFGPRGLAQATLERLWQVTLGRRFGS
jgi:tetratricopeptide (TPR) repeat protein